MTMTNFNPVHMTELTVTSEDGTVLYQVLIPPGSAVQPPVQVMEWINTPGTIVQQRLVAQEEKPVPEAKYPTETLDGDEDDGTMPENVAELADAVVGHKIVGAGIEKLPRASSWRGQETGLVLTLDNGKRVILRDTDDCCAYTALEKFLMDPRAVDHIILGVGTTDGYEKWHIYADFGDVMELQVGWSCGNPFYYGYGFDITVEDIPS